MLSVTLDRGSAEPLVLQLYRAVRELIITGRLASGARLPSTRKLSRDLQVSRTVTLDAFAQLTAEGFVEGRHGSGHFVASLPLGGVGKAAAATAPKVDRGGASIYSEAGVPFDPAWQDVELFPSQVWARMLGRGWRRHQSDALGRHWAGLPVLREVVAQHLLALRGILLTPDQVMITSGHVDAISLIAGYLALERKGRISAWIEDPGLGTTRQALTKGGVDPIPIPVDGEGLVVAEGERRAPDAALAVVTPTRQFPLGMPLSLSRRLSLLAWAKASGALVVDDDYDGEVRFSGRPLQSLASLDPGGRVLTLGSFSKLTFSGLRLGYAAGPPDLIAELVARRRENYALVPSNVQAALAEFISTGNFARHLRQLRTRLTRRRKILHEALREHAGGLVEILPQEAGMHLTVRLTDAVARSASDVAIAERARKSGLVLMPLSQQYAGEAAEQGFFLGYAGWDEERLVAATVTFVELLREITRE